MANPSSMDDLNLDNLFGGDDLFGGLDEIDLGGSMRYHPSGVPPGDAAKERAAEASAWAMLSELLMTLRERELRHLQHSMR